MERSKLELRNSEIYERFYAGASAPELSASYGLSLPQIHKIIRTDRERRAQEFIHRTGLNQELIERIRRRLAADRMGFSPEGRATETAEESGDGRERRRKMGLKARRYLFRTGRL